MTEYTLTSGDTAKVRRQDTFSSCRHGLVYVYHVENKDRPFLYCEAWVYDSPVINSTIESHGDIGLDGKAVIEAAELHHRALS